MTSILMAVYMAVSKVLSGVLVVVYMSVRFIGPVFHTDDHALHLVVSLILLNTYIMQCYIMQGGVF